MCQQRIDNIISSSLIPRRCAVDAAFDAAVDAAVDSAVDDAVGADTLIGCCFVKVNGCSDLFCSVVVEHIFVLMNMLVYVFVFPPKEI